MKKSLQITVSGRVQGVSFRYYTQKAAKARGLKGFVKNLPNGDVYIEVQGPQNQLNIFSEEVRRGPFLSRVDDILINEMIFQNYSDFIIR